MFCSLKFCSSTHHVLLLKCRIFSFFSNSLSKMTSVGTLFLCLIRWKKFKLCFSSLKVLLIDWTLCSIFSIYVWMNFLPLFLHSWHFFTWKKLINLILLKLFLAHREISWHVKAKCLTNLTWAFQKTYVYLIRDVQLFSMFNY